MPKINKKSPGDAFSPRDLLETVLQALKKSAVTVVWETIDRWKRTVKVKIELGLRFVIGAGVVVIGLVFALSGLAKFIDRLIGWDGAGWMLVGGGMIIFGVWVGERAKARMEETRRKITDN